MDQQSVLFAPQPRGSVAIVPLLRRQLWLSLAIVLGSMALGVVVSLLWPRTYVATATLAYDPQISLTRGGGGLAMTDAQRDAAIDAQLAQVTTMAVAQTVAGLVDPAANPKLAEEAGKVAARSERRLGRNEALGTALLAHVKARRVGQTPDFTIAFATRNAAQAAVIANGFATGYLASAVRQKAALADGGARQLIASVARLHDAATAADRRLAAFRLANHLLNTPNSPALDQEVAALRGQLADAHGQAALAGTRSAMAGTRSVVGGGSGGSVDTAAVSALTQQRATAAADLAALLGRYGEKHPEVIAARQKLAESDAQLAQAMRGNRTSAAIEARAAGARAQALAGSLQTAEAQLAGNLGHDAQLLDLQNSALAARLAYQDALKIAADQTAQRALIQPDAQVIALAYPPLRPQSRTGVILLVALGLGLGGAAAAGTWREARRRTLGSAEDIVRWLGIDFFAPLPLLAAGLPMTRSADPIAAALQQPQSAFAASIRSLATTVLFAARQRDTQGGRVIGITSATRGEGKTTTSIAMGRVLAAAGMKVTLIDGDAHGGSGIRAMGGFSGTVDTVGIADRGFDMPPGAVGGELARMVATLRHDYDVVIVDTAPILPGGDSRQLLACLDALVLLVRWRATPVPTIRTAIRRITAAGGRISGAALTMAGGAMVGGTMAGGTMAGATTTAAAMS